MQVLCLACGRPIRLEDNAYANFEGMLRCAWCKSLFYAEIRGGHVKTTLPRDPRSPFPRFTEYFKNFEEVQIDEKEYDLRDGKAKPGPHRPRVRVSKARDREKSVEIAERVFGIPAEDLPELEAGAESGTSGDGVESEREQESERKAELGPGDPDGGGLQPIGHRSSESRKPQPLP
ncbi:MAG: hypothetical protein ACTSRF_09310 [Candidatus Freyarchaeota archaeon]